MNIIELAKEAGLFESLDDYNVELGLHLAPLTKFAELLQQAIEPFQTRVDGWMQQCFGSEISKDKVERNHRFLEEALELVQALGCTREEANQLVDYVFSRDIGEPSQEVGGVMVTLAALCSASDMDMQACGESELTRILVPEIVEKIRRKQAAKPKFSPLPQVTQASEPVTMIDLEALIWEKIKTAIKNSPWIPKEYMMNEVVYDIVKFLTEPRVQASEPVGEVQSLNEDNDSWLLKLPVGTKVYTSSPNTQSEIAKLRAVLKDERESANDLTKSIAEKVREKIELQAKLNIGREALQDLINSCESANERCLDQIGLGLIDLIMISKAKATLKEIK
jgi:hypothetical protein